MQILFHWDVQHRANIGSSLFFFHHTGKLFNNPMFRKIGCGLLRDQPQKTMFAVYGLRGFHVIEAAVGNMPGTVQQR